MPPELLDNLPLVAVIAIPIAILVVVVLRAMNDWQPIGMDDLRRLKSNLRRIRTADVLRLLWKAGVCALVVLLFLVSLAGSIAAVAFVFVLVLVYQRYRMARQQAILATLAVAAERRGGAAARTRKVADALERGATLADAMASAGTLVPRQAMLKIRVGQDAGNLPEALREAGQADLAVDSVRAQLGGKLMYIGLIALFGVGVFVFVTKRIIPSFEKIFKDSATQLPAVTRFFISACHATMQFWPLTILPLFLLLLYLVAFAVAGFDANFPILRRLVRRLDTAGILESLALVTSRRRPLTEGILTLAVHYPKLTVRRGLAQTFTAIHAGANWIDSLLGQRLIRPADAAILRAAERAGNLPWALREVADGNRRRFNYRVYVLLQWLFPLAVLLVGLTVALLAAACFTPLVALLQRLAG